MRLFIVTENYTPFNYGETQTSVIGVFDEKWIAEEFIGVVISKIHPKKAIRKYEYEIEEFELNKP